ncbi:MAG: SsrA-binding protein SmpB [Planctomycetaceae bacterium]
MSQKSGHSSSTKDASKDRVVCKNRRALHDYEIVESLQCGIVLVGSEVKSIRNNRITIEDAYARVDNGEVYLVNVDISEYANAALNNHERRRTRKLLLKRREVRKFAEIASQQGLTLIPLEVLFVRGLVKVVIGIGRGRREYDKRQKLKQNDADKAIRNALKHKLR